MEGPLFLDAAATVRRVVPARRSRHAIGRDAKHPLLESRSLRALRTLHVSYRVLRQLSQRTVPLPCVALAGTPKIALSLYNPENFDHGGAFDRVRAISVEGGELNRHMRAVLERPLFGQLEHLDLTFGVNGEVWFPEWQAWLDSTQLARLSARLPLEDDLSESLGSYDPSTYIHVEIERGTDRVIVQLDDKLYPDHVAAAIDVVIAIAGPRRRVRVEDLADSNRCAEHRADVLAALRPKFDDVVAATGAVRSRAP